MKRIILFFLFVLTALPLLAQTYKTVVPYRLAGGKMIVEMKMNGTLRSFIFDTGASRTTLTGEICRVLSPRNNRKHPHSGRFVPIPKYSLHDFAGTITICLLSSGRIDRQRFACEPHIGD